MAHARETRTQRSPSHRCCTAPPTTDTESAGLVRDKHDWNVLFRQFRDELDLLRNQVGSPGGPTELALTVIAEAVAIGEALTVGSSAPTTSNGIGHDIENNIDHETHDALEGMFDSVDCRYLDHRARALRAALCCVDDFVWWGGLRAAAAGDRLT